MDVYLDVYVDRWKRSVHDKGVRGDCRGGAFECACTLCVRVRVRVQVRVHVRAPFVAGNGER